ncbi:hypothetical protein DFH07DRAFT_743097 [Mycena maculata]|uniref:BOD1/SHG1 domain-containing protein n=1 Tax=Mycena maculata TaxID=230809 RepID=A0AAD7J3L5_9AGAR|nr:hypothetical protein DFH07DRAFT_743097 [Mycena maculata]
MSRFKNSGEFDKLRRELLLDCQRSGGFDAFKARIEEIARARIDSGQLAYTTPDKVHKELMQEVNRFPVVERFASEVPMLSDGAFKDGIRSSMQRILREDRGQKEPPSAASAPLPEPPAPSQPSTTDASAKEEPPIPPVLPPQEADVPLVPRGSPSEANRDGKMEMSNRAPLTTTQETSPVPPPPPRR